MYHIIDRAACGDRLVQRERGEKSLWETFIAAWFAGQQNQRQMDEAEGTRIFEFLKFARDARKGFRYDVKPLSPEILVAWPWTTIWNRDF